MHQFGLLARRALATTIVATGFLSFAGSNSWAIQQCAEYAARAISQVEMAQGCFQGSIWSAKVADHLAWCRGKTPQQMTSEDAVRRSELARGCRSGTARVSIRSCEEYAWRAMSQIELAHQMANTLAACRFTGARWELNVNAHIGFCRSRSLTISASEDFERRKAIAQCSPNAGPPPSTVHVPVPSPTNVAPRPQPTAPQPAPTAGLSADQQIMLNAHNAERAKHCVAALTWSPQAAAAAQQWASRCTRSGTAFAHDSARGTYGENLAWGTGLGPAAAVTMWYGEISSYNFAAPVWTWSPQIGHFTQLVWRTTTQVGCAAAQCGSETLWVCRYLPSGNMNVEARPGFTAAQAQQSLIQGVPRACR